MAIGITAIRQKMARRVYNIGDYMRIRISKEQNLHDIENFIDYLNKHSLCSAKLVIDSNKYYLEI